MFSVAWVGAPMAVAGSTLSVLTTRTRRLLWWWCSSRRSLHRWPRFRRNNSTAQAASRNRTTIGRPTAGSSSSRDRRFSEFIYLFFFNFPSIIDRRAKPRRFELGSSWSAGVRLRAVDSRLANRAKAHAIAHASVSPTRRTETDRYAAAGSAGELSRRWHHQGRRPTTRRTGFTVDTATAVGAGFGYANRGNVGRQRARPRGSNRRSSTGGYRVSRLR